LYNVGALFEEDDSFSERAIVCMALSVFERCWATVLFTKDCSFALRGNGLSAISRQVA